MSDELSLECRVASLIHSHFDNLPARCKPKIQCNGQKEWVPLSGIVLVTGESTPQESLTCVALATGAKCLSASQIPQCNGLVLHDSHAEVLALRAFNHWLLEECRSALIHRKNHLDLNNDHSSNTCFPNVEGSADPNQVCSGSKFLRWRQPRSETIIKSGNKDTPNQRSQPFQLKSDVKIWMYCTCAPCGDASMELCMATQDDPTPWDPPDTEQSANKDHTDLSHTLLNGRAHFSILGAVRRKPSRADAESTLSKSCSDKLAVKQLTSLLSSQTALLVAPSENAYITDFLLPEDEINPVGYERSFGDGETGRLRSIKGRVWQSHSTDIGYRFRRFRFRSLPKSQLDILWMHGKPLIGGSKSGNISAVWTATPSSSAQPPYSQMDSAPTDLPTEVPTGLREILINGVKQGYRISSPGHKKASDLSRARMWCLLREIVHLLPNEDVLTTPTSREDTLGHGFHAGYIHQLKEVVLESTTYASMKAGTATIGSLQDRNEVLDDVRSTLRNWIKNRGDDAWGLAVIDNVPDKKRTPSRDGSQGKMS